MHKLQSYSAFGPRVEDLDPEAEVDFGDDDDDEEMLQVGNDEDPFASIIPVTTHGPSFRHEDGPDAAGGLGDRKATKRRSTFQIGEEEDDFGDEDAQRFLADDEADAETESEMGAGFEQRDVLIDDEMLEEEDPVEVFRRELLSLQEGLHYEEWGVLGKRQKASGLIEPAVLGSLDIPPDVMYYARLYSLVQAGLALLLPYSLMMLTGVPATRALGSGLFVICTIGSIVDIVARIVTYLPKRSKSGIAFDVLVSLASLIAVASPDLAGGMFVYVSMLRGVRVFRFIYLFKDYETFQDIYLVQQTIVGSVSVLLIIGLFAFIAIFISSTFLWATESTYFDRTLGVWIRECALDVPCNSIVSPFQSIPAAMWLAFQCVTLTGYGDTFPASSMGRVFAGLTCVCGVFCIAFPTTVLIGNLQIIRNTFFKEKEIRENRITAEAVERITESLELEQKEHHAARREQAVGGETPRRDIDLEDQMNNTLPLLYGSYIESDLQIQKDRIAMHMTTMQQSGSFLFMSATPRQVTLLETGVYMYLPILQIACGEDKLPLLGNVTRVDATTSTVTLFLCVDDPVAQRAAVRAVNGDANAVARAAPIVSLSVATTKTHPAVTLFRRDDVGEVHDNYIALVFLVRSAHRFGNMTRLRRAFLGTRLTISYTPSISAGAVWSETIFVTADMLAPTKFIAELKGKSVMVAPTVFFNEEEKDELDEEDLVLKRRKNIAFIQPDHIYQLLDGVFAGIEVPPGATIRNREEILDGVLALILLHSRELYFRDIPPLIHTAVFDLEEITPYDKVVEVDLEFFRKSEWPMGTVVVRYGYDAQEMDAEVYLTEDACEGEQPRFQFTSALNEEYSLDNEDDAADAEETPVPAEDTDWPEEEGPSESTEEERGVEGSNTS